MKFILTKYEFHQHMGILTETKLVTSSTATIEINGFVNLKTIINMLENK